MSIISIVSIMGNAASTATPNAGTATAQRQPMAAEGCPYHEKSAAAAPPPASQCPVQHGKKVYNVYAQEIDPTNRMPVEPNTLPSPRQAKPLSNERVRSSIPKGGTDETWTYPSPQMFYNALSRKGKGDDVDEDDVDIVVAIHNNMNERTWRQILAWENDYHRYPLAVQ